MLKNLFDKANPDTCVGAEKFKKKLQNVHIEDYEGCVNKLLNGMAANYRHVL